MTDRGFSSVADLVSRWAQQRPDAPAVTGADGVTVSFAEIDGRAAALAQRLPAAGPIAYVGNDAAWWATVMVASMRRGLPAMPINWRLSRVEVDRLMAHARPTLVFADPALAHLVTAGAAPVDGDAVVVVRDGTPADPDSLPLVDAAPHVASPDDVALLMFTSGTSGTPKAVEITSGNIAANLDTPAPWHVDEHSVVAVPAPLFHLSGTGWLFYCLARGSHFVSTLGVAPSEVREALLRARATHMLTVPAILQTFVRDAETAREPLADLHTVIYAGSPMPPALITRALDALRCDLIQSYGMTETCGPITFLTPEDHRVGGARLASAGRVVPGVGLQVRVPGDDAPADVGETGEVWTRSALVTPGYRENDAENARAFDADGWFRTGDCGHVDADGYLYLTDRLSDMIITGGENVYPVEVENVLAEHPAVAEVAVVGAPHEKWGETVRAFVVSADGQSPDPAELIAFCRDAIAHYKCPTRVDVVESLPRTGTGKVIKKDLRAALASTGGADAHR